MRMHNSGNNSVYFGGAGYLDGAFPRGGSLYVCRDIWLAPINDRQIPAGKLIKLGLARIDKGTCLLPVSTLNNPPTELLFGQFVPQISNDMENNNKSN